MKKLTVAAVLILLATAAAAKPLKIYILAGQSNMEGHGAVSTFDYIGEDPETAPMLKEMRNKDGKLRVCENVWISHVLDHADIKAGAARLTAGYGGGYRARTPGHKIGPEFTFGIYVGKAYDGPILLIKTAWGGKSLNTDFRSPSAGPYRLNDWQKDHYTKRKMDLKEWQAKKDQATGHYYRLMMSHVKKVLGNIKDAYPDYDPEEGHEIAGFVWFQGWNDMCDSHTYPNRNEPGGYAEYSSLMAHFIRDVRKELKAHGMPFVIGVIGVGGDKAKGGIANLRPAMAAPAEMAEFKGTVAAIQTGDFWDHEMEALMPKKGHADHLLRAAYVIDDDGVRQERDSGVPDWEPLGKPSPEDRTWRFISIDPQETDDESAKKEKKRFRTIDLPEKLENWYKPDFDDSKWNNGKAPIGKGKWKHRSSPEVKYNSDWGSGEFLLMRTTFKADDLDYEAYRISILARQGFQVYLNGHLVHTYIWWKDEPFYRPIGLDASHVKHLKKGENVLAVYANAEFDKKTGEPFASIDAMIEAITKEDLKYVESEEYRLKKMTKVCTPREAKIILGASNGGYHYLGSGKMLGQIGKAFAEAMLRLEAAKR